MDPVAHRGTLARFDGRQDAARRHAARRHATRHRGRIGAAVIATGLPVPALGQAWMPRTESRSE